MIQKTKPLKKNKTSIKKKVSKRINTVQCGQV